MRNFFLIVNVLWLTIALAKDESYFFSPIGERNKISFPQELNLVTNIPVSQIRPLDVLHIEAFPDEVGDYNYRFVMHIDGIYQEVRSSDPSNFYDFNVPAFFDRIELTIEAQGIFNGVFLTKTIVLEYSVPLVLSKNKVYQKEDLTITHPLIKTGQSYNVVFSNGLDFSQVVQVYALLDGEVVAKVPSYQGIEKLSVSIQGIRNRERKKITINQGAGVTGNKSELKPFEYLFLTILEDINLDQETYAGTLNGNPVVLSRNSENVLAWPVENLPEGLYSLIVNISNMEFHYDFSILAASTINNPEGYLNNFLQDFNNQVGMIENDPEFSNEFKQKMRQIVDEAFQLREELTIEETKNVVMFLNSNDFNFEMKNKKNIFLHNEMTDAEASTKIAIYNILKGVVIGAAGAGAIAAIKSLNLPIQIKNPCVGRTAPCALLAAAAVGATIWKLIDYLGNKGSKIADEVLKQEELEDPQKFMNERIFEDSVPVTFTPMSKYSSLNMNDANSSESTIKLAYNFFINTRDSVRSISNLIGGSIDIFDISTYPPKPLITKPTDPKYLVDVVNISEENNNVSKYLFKSLNDKIQYAFLSDAQAETTFTYYIKYSFPGIVSNKLTELTGKIKPLLGCSDVSISQAGRFVKVLNSPDLGGFVAKTATIFITPKTIIEKDVMVCDQGQVLNDSRSYGRSRVFGNGIVFNDATIKDDAWVYDHGRVFNGATVTGNAKIFGNANIFGGLITGNAQVYGEFPRIFGKLVNGNAQIYDFAQIFDNTIVTDNAKVYGNARIFGNSVISGSAQICGDAVINNQSVGGGTVICPINPKNKIFQNKLVNNWDIISEMTHSTFKDYLLVR